MGQSMIERMSWRLRQGGRVDLMKHEVGLALNGSQIEGLEEGVLVKWEPPERVDASNFARYVSSSARNVFTQSRICFQT